MWRLATGAVPMPTFPPETVKADKFVSSVWMADTILFHSDEESVAHELAVAG